MDLQALADSLELMSEQALSRFVKRCLCSSIHRIDKFSQEGLDIQVALDMAYAECCRRDNERLYDMAYESVTAHPEICSAA